VPYFYLKKVRYYKSVSFSVPSLYDAVFFIRKDQQSDVIAKLDEFGG
jgi:hypothetical protein